jgi:hypothetical protein
MTFDGLPSPATGPRGVRKATRDMGSLTCSRRGFSGRRRSHNNPTKDKVTLSFVGLLYETKLPRDFLLAVQILDSEFDPLRVTP